MSTIQFYYTNWWTGDAVTDLQQFLEYCFDQYDLNTGVKKNIHICSLFGSLQSIARIPKTNETIVLFYTGENTDAWVDWREEIVYPHVDIIAGFFEKTNKSVRCPLWCFYYPFWKSKCFVPKQDDNNRLNEAVCIARNPSNRYKLANLCQQSGVRIATNLPNHTESIPGSRSIEGLDKRLESKLNCLSFFKYNLCPENTDAIGYTTEKIFHAFESGCIPIYYPNRPVEENILNQDCIVFIDPNDTPEEIKSKLSVVQSPQFCWKNDATFYIMKLYLNLWKKVLQLAKQKGWIVKRKSLPNEGIIKYNLKKRPVCSLEVEEICKMHYNTSSSLFTPRPVFVTKKDSNDSNDSSEFDDTEIDLEEVM